MITMAILLGIIFIGITVVAHAYAIVPSVDNSGGPTVVALVAGTVFGASPLFYLFQIAHGPDPVPGRQHQLQRLPPAGRDPGRGRLHAPPVQLPGRSAGLLVGHRPAGRRSRSACWSLFNGDTHALIPLYSVGVFVCFTLSQSGMVKHWFTTRETGWWWRAIVNAFGCVLTFVVLIIVTSVKFQNGAYLVIILIPLLVAMMLFIQRQYAASQRQLAIRPDYVAKPPHREERVVIPIPGLTRAVIQAVNVGRSISEDVRAVYISEDPEAAMEVRKQWERQVPGVPAGRRRVALSGPRRAAPGLPRRARPRLAAGQARADHLRGRARVRRSALVGADPLQPVRRSGCGPSSSGGPTP